MPRRAIRSPEEMRPAVREADLFVRKLCVLEGLVSRGELVLVYPETPRRAAVAIDAAAWESPSALLDVLTDDEAVEEVFADEEQLSDALAGMETDVTEEALLEEILRPSLSISNGFGDGTSDDEELEFTLGETERRNLAAALVTTAPDVTAIVGELCTGASFGRLLRGQLEDAVTEARNAVKAFRTSEGAPGT